MPKQRNVVQKTKMELLRSDSSGIPGTIANAEHHAEHMLPFIHAMKDEVGYLGFALHRAGNNVHEFVADDGRRFTLRGFKDGKEYAGVRLSYRHSRSEEVRLVDINDVSQCPALLDVMAMMASPKLGEIVGGPSKAT